jgi:N-acetylneuraminic acid mutarotase
VRVLDSNRLMTLLRSAKVSTVLIALVLLGVGCGTYDRGPRRSADRPTLTADETLGTDRLSTWIRLPDAPTPRTELGATYMDGSIYAAGGIGIVGGTGRVLSTFEAFDVASSAWRALPDLPEPRHHSAVAALDGSVYVIGGFSDMAFTPSAKVFAFDVSTGKWRQASPLPEPLGAGGAAVLDGKIYFVGGVDKDGKTSARMYAFDGQRWQRLRDMPTPREHLAVAATSSFLYVLGGRQPITAAAERYDPDEDSWESLAPKPTARGGIAGAGVGGRFACAAGGEDDRRTYADAECFDETAGKWISLPAMSVARHGLGAAGTEKEFYTISGGDRPGLAQTSIIESISVG